MYHYGYKRYTATDENGLVLAEVTTPANASDIQNLHTPLEKLSDIPEGTIVLADKGYHSAFNESDLKERKLGNGIMHRSQKNKPLSDMEKRVNRLISSSRYAVERTFGSIKRWLKAGVARELHLQQQRLTEEQAEVQKMLVK